MSLLMEAVEKHRIGDPITFKNLTLYPLGNGNRREPDYLLLDEALRLGVLSITELSEAGRVPELKVVNQGDRRVLLLDGEELVGAKQNRILNLTILVPARSTLVVPVSCVEAGRWNYRSREFAASPTCFHASGRAMKTGRVSESLRSEGSRMSDQHEVWASVAEISNHLGVHSPTAAMADIYERHSASLEDYIQAFHPSEGQVGAIFQIGGRLSGMDLFDCPAAFTKLMPKLVRSYALDALDIGGHGNPASDPEAAQRFLALIGQARCESFKAVGDGEDLRFRAPELTGAALAEGGRIVHLCAFRLAEERSGRSDGGGRSSMSRPSDRAQRFRQVS